MAESRSPPSDSGAPGAELCLSPAPEPSPPCDGLSGEGPVCEGPVCQGPCTEGQGQSCCEARETSPETVRNSKAPADATGPCSEVPCSKGLSTEGLSSEGLSCEGLSWEGCRTVQCLRASLPVSRSHSDSVSALQLQLGVDTRAPNSCTLAPDCCKLVNSGCGGPLVDSGGVGPLVDSGGPVLVCKRSMQLQQCNMVTTVCRGALGPNGPIPQMCQGPPGAQGPQTAASEEPSCDRTLCYGSHLLHTNLEDTFAAYCHPQPIPAPSQLMAPLTGPEGPSLLSLPRLMSSVSETGLDNKHMPCCCQLGCSWVNMLPPCPVRATRDVGTLTVEGPLTLRPLKDVGVQTDDSSTHVFPQVCLSEDHRGHKDTQRADTQRADTQRADTQRADTQRADTQRAGCKCPLEEAKGTKDPQKSPVKEVKWDSEGMTWEVYGASVDPEELGLAIQKHLELQIRETANRAAKLSRQNTNTSQHSAGSCQRKRRVLGPLRPPVCCTRTSTAVD